ncbi:MAG: 4'-phosphopantetheinyl transferase superfamily protein [Flavobacteriales bacterium]
MHQIKVLHKTKRYTIFSLHYAQTNSNLRDVRFLLEKEAQDYFLEKVLGSHVRIRKLPSGRPVLDGSDKHISISHSSDRFVVQLSSCANPGIDTEHFRPQLVRVAPKFLSERERIVCEQNDKLRLLCLHWSAKEAIYKSADIAGLSFAHHIHIESIAFISENEGYISALLNTPRIHCSYRLRFFLPSNDEAIVFVDQITEQA